MQWQTWRLSKPGFFSGYSLSCQDFEVFASVYTTQRDLQVRAAQLRRSRWQLLRPQLTSHRSKGELRGSRDHRKKSFLRQSDVNELELGEIVGVNERSVLI